MTIDNKQWEQKVNAADKILVVYGQNSTFSAVAMALSVYLWLRARGKQVTLVSPVAPVVEFSPLVGINKVKTKLTGENLVVTLPFPASTIDKVISDLNQTTDQLSLIVKPKRGAATYDLASLPVNYQAPDYDLIIMISVSSINELLTLGSTSANYWTQTERNITWNDFANPASIPAAISVSLGKNDTYALSWGNFCRQANLTIDADQASNILMALEQENDHFGAVTTSAEAFELAAWLLRQGATRYQPDERALNDFRPENHLPHLPEMIGIDTEEKTEE